MCVRLERLWAIRLWKANPEREEHWREPYPQEAASLQCFLFPVSEHCFHFRKRPTHFGKEELEVYNEMLADYKEYRAEMKSQKTSAEAGKLTSGAKEELEARESLCVHEQPAYCNAACPLKLDTKAMVAALAAGDFSKALQLYEKIIFIINSLD